MAKIRFKLKSLIQRFGTKPIEVSESMAKQYVDRNQAVLIREGVAKVKEVEVKEVIEKVPDKEEMEIKIKKTKK